MTYYLIYAIVLGIASVYSYVLLDPNITLLNHPAWTAFRDAAVQIGYHNRPLSTAIYLAILAGFTGMHIWTLRRKQKPDPIKIALLIGGILTFSYPFLSHDLFNYMFDAKILTFYHQNPYVRIGLDYPDDTWIRFMHWVHRPYPYGPVFLAVSAVPSLLGMGKFLIHYFLIKALFGGFYIASVYYIGRFNKSLALFFATSPLVLVEILISSHNEVVALAFGLAGLFFMMNKDGILSTTLLIASAAVKFMSFPFMLVANGKYYWMNYFALLAMISVLVYASVKVEIQSWYFINLFFFLPIFPNLIKRFGIFFTSLLLSYYPYIMLGGWDSDFKVDLKHWIITAGFILNLIYLGYVVLKNKKGLRFLLDEALSKEERT